MAVTTTIKTPSECSHSELGDFAALVLAGGEVTLVGLNDRIKDAHVLIFLHKNYCLVGIAALKNPNSNYRAAVFKNANSTQPYEQYPLELGWIFVLPSARNNGYSKRLVRAAVEHARQRQIFATSRTDNPHMHTPLLNEAFVKHGSDYKSHRGMYSLSLFLRSRPTE